MQPASASSALDTSNHPQRRVVISIVLHGLLLSGHEDPATAPPVRKTLTCAQAEYAPRRHHHAMLDSVDTADRLDYPA
jgi:hypothetical protein